MILLKREHCFLSNNIMRATAKMKEFCMLKKKLLGTQRILCMMALIFGAMLTTALVGCVFLPEDDDVITVAGTQANPVDFSSTDGSGTYSLTTAVPSGWFKFTANGRYTLTVRDSMYRPTGATTSPYTLDVRVTVMDSSLGYVADINNRQMNAVDIGSNTNADVTLTDLIGVFYVKIDPYNSGNTGTFYISVTNAGQVTAGASELDAIDITNYSPTPFQLELTSSRPARYFKFTADGRYTLTIRDSMYRPTGATTSPYTLDARVTVLDTSLNFVADINNRQMNAVDIGSNTNADVTLTDLTGVFYVRINPYNTNNYGSFYIALTKTGPVTAGFDQTDAIPLVIGAPRITDELTSSRPARWFAFTAPSSGTVNLTVFDSMYNPTGLNEAKPNVDVRVTVLDSVLSYMTNSDGTEMNMRDIGSNTQSPVTFNGLTPGSVYYVKIDPYNTNNYGFFYIGIE